ncbi:MAG: hypothetical protein ACI8W8_002768, partial [Rhodothermales bacterium]
MPYRIFFILLPVLLTGCLGTRSTETIPLSPTDPAAAPSSVAVIYYAYGYSQERALASPHPN